MGYDRAALKVWSKLGDDMAGWCGGGGTASTRGNIVTGNEVVKLWQVCVVWDEDGTRRKISGYVEYVTMMKYRLWEVQSRGSTQAGSGIGSQHVERRRKRGRAD